MGFEAERRISKQGMGTEFTSQIYCTIVSGTIANSNYNCITCHSMVQFQLTPMNFMITPRAKKLRQKKLLIPHKHYDVQSMS